METTAIYHNEPLQNACFLVTGGAGFIGSNIVEYLINNGAKLVRVLDNLSNGNIKNIEQYIGLPNFEFIDGDIRNYDTCLRACETIDYVSHQAALGSVQRSIADPISTNEVNISGYVNMLKAAHTQGIKLLVYASSSSVYGDNSDVIKDEQRIGNPLSPYAVTKQANELYAKVFGQTIGLNTIGLRYFNVFGPKQNPNGPYAAVIPLFVQSILSKTSPIIYGDGSQTRDFTYVSNVVQANVKAMLSTNIDAYNQVYNVALGDKTSVNGLWESLSDIGGVNIKPDYRPLRNGEILNSLATIDKAKSLLGYVPEINVKDGLQDTFVWFKENINEYGK